MPIAHVSDVATGSMIELDTRIFEAQAQIETWFKQAWQSNTPPFYGSVDLRHSGFKLASIDTNLFPGGFNNLNQACHPQAVEAAANAMSRVCQDAQNILLIPENHTRNTYYRNNIATLVDILQSAGFHVRLGTLSTDIDSPFTVHQHIFQAMPLERSKNRVRLSDGFDPCLILLNNDLSAGIPALLDDLEQTILPPLHAGWALRRKTKHFAAYATISKAFAQLLALDPWLINPLFSRCAGLDFQTHQGEEALADTVSTLLAQIRVKYKEYNIPHPPFVIVKADAGTYGMGVMRVKQPEDVLNLNRKTRNKMSVVKDGLIVSEVIVQEGIYTFDKVEGAVAEPVIYMIDKEAIGGFYRVHTERRYDDNLNSPGMHFAPFPLSTMAALHELPTHAQKRFYAYDVMARLSLLAAAQELKDTERKSA